MLIVVQFKTERLPETEFARLLKQTPPLNRDLPDQFQLSARRVSPQQANGLTTEVERWMKRTYGISFFYSGKEILRYSFLYQHSNGIARILTGEENLLRRILEEQKIPFKKAELPEGSIIPPESLFTPPVNCYFL